MKISKQNRHDAKQLFRSCVHDQLLDDARVRKVVTAVLQQKPRGYHAILTHFQRLLKLELIRRAARVESAVALSPQEQAAVQGSLTAKYGPGLSFSFAQNPSLLGGMRIQVGSDVYDGSVRQRLENLREAF